MSDLKLIKNVVTKYAAARRVPQRGVIDFGRGIVAPEGAHITLQKGCPYYLGASSMPDFVILTDVDDDRVSYEKSPFKGNKIRIERWIAADLIAKGTKRGLETYGDVMSPDLKASMVSCLKGGKGRPVDIEDYRPVTVDAIPSEKYKGQDLWRAAEEYGNVGGRYDKEDEMTYEIDTNRLRAEKMKNDSRFQVLKVTKRS